MPPWHLDRTIGESSPDPSLGDAEVATIARWVDTGSPKGDPKDAPAPRVFAANDAWQFGEEPDIIVTSPPITVLAKMNIGWLDFYYISDQEYADVQKEASRTKPTAER